MANPRQRRKARSSSHRPVSLSRRAKKNLKKTPREPHQIRLVDIPLNVVQPYGVPRRSKTRGIREKQLDKSVSLL